MENKGAETQNNNGLGNRELVLDLVKGDNFHDLFPRNTPERQATAIWEKAIALDSPAALLDIQLMEHFTLQQALEEGHRGYDNRHGTMHIK